MTKRRRVANESPSKSSNSESSENQTESEPDEESIGETTASARTSSTVLRSTSWVWEFFTKEHNNQVTTIVCTICKKRYKHTNTPGTLAKHITKCHSKKIPTTQSTLERYIQKPYAQTDKRYQQLTK